MLYKSFLAISLLASSLFAGVVVISSEAQFHSVISKGSIVIDFYAEWCGPCKAMHPIINQLAGEFPSVTFVKVDTGKFPSIASSYGVMSIPAFVFQKNGVVNARANGSMKKDKMASYVRAIL